MIEKALKYFADLKAKSLRESTIEINGITYQQGHDNELRRLPAEMSYEAKIEASTLDSLIRYITKNKDGFGPEDIIIHIVNPEKVNVLTYKRDYYNDRKVIFSASKNKLHLPTNESLSLERFKIGLMTMFEKTPELLGVMEAVSKIKEIKEDVIEDDGFSQKATIKNGVELVEKGIIKPIVELMPFRTFLEVEQPKSPFLFRISGEGQDRKFCLYEADGGKWKAEAIENIRVYLEKSLPAEALILP